MTVRVLYGCPHCGCQLFRPSNAWVWKDLALRLLGVRPYRCQMCGNRFYLFQPRTLRLLARISSSDRRGVLHMKEKAGGLWVADRADE